MWLTLNEIAYLVFESNMSKAFGIACFVTRQIYQKNFATLVPIDKDCRKKNKWSEWVSILLHQKFSLMIVH